MHDVMVYTFGKYPPSYSIVNKRFADFKLNSTEHTQYTHVRYKNSNTQGSSPYVVKKISHTLRKRIRSLWEQILSFKDIYSCPTEIIKGLADKGQFHYLTKLRGPQDGTYR